jgi:hypothetical protein
MQKTGLSPRNYAKLHLVEEQTNTLIKDMLTTGTNENVAALLAQAGENAIEKKLDETFQKIISLILIVLMTFGLLMASIFCVIQYVMCIFEYFIVTAVGVIFIPFCLWDGTKSFTAKLVTLLPPISSRSWSWFYASFGYTARLSTWAHPSCPAMSRFPFCLLPILSLPVY